MRRLMQLLMCGFAAGVLVVMWMLANTNSVNAQQQADAKYATADAICVLQATQGNTTAGVIRLHEEGGQVTLTAMINGLEPGSTHAWHIHELGDISDPAGKATGGHYNPQGHDHALPDTQVRHAGDLGNLTADGYGNANAEMTVSHISIAGDHNPVIGRAFIIHALADDGGQPTGNAGGRIAQGVIGYAKPLP